MRQALALTASCLALFLLGPALAKADITFCPPGSGAGQCNGPDAVAVDEETGELFVIDTGNRRVEVFDEEGGFLRAFGWDAIPAGAPGDTGTGLETCTAASGCQAGSEGTGAGQFKGNGPDAIAIDNDPSSLSQHAVYVADTDNFRVQKFSPNGGFLWMVGGGVNKGGGAPANPGNLCTAGHLANGDICGAGANSKATGAFFSHFDGLRPIPLGVGPGGVVHVADGPAKGSAESDGYENRVQTFAPEGSFIEEIELPELSKGREMRAFAVDRTSGDFYVNERAGEVHRYDATGTLLEVVPELFAVALAVDGEGDLFATPGFQAAIYQYDSGGAPVRTFYGNGTLEDGVEALAPHSSATGDLFVLEASVPRRLAHISFPPPGPVVLPTAAQVGDSPFAIQQADTKAEPVGSVRGTFKTSVNPEGKATEVRFEYVDDAAYQQDKGNGGDGFEGPETIVTDPADTDPASIPPDTVKWIAHEASLQIACPDPETELAEGKCLQAETVYHLRAVAENEDGEDTGPEASFETLPPIELGDAWSTAVGSESARLHAGVNPNEVPGTVRFQYVEESAYLKDIEEGGNGFAGASETPEVDFGEGNAMTSRSALVGSLAEGTTYRFRYLATNFFGSFEGPTRSFTTRASALSPRTDCPNQALRLGAAATLPDCRAYELVSPLEKGSGDILSGNGSHFGVPVEQAAPSGAAIAYTSLRAFGDSVSSPFFSQYLARRDPEAGWSSNSLNPPLGGGNLYQGVYQRPIYKAFSEDLCSAWLTQNTELTLTPGAPAGVPNLYRRRNCGGEPFELQSTVAAPGFGREGEEGTNESEGDTGSTYFPGVGGWSEDGTLSAFKAAAALTPQAHVVGAGKPLTCELGFNTAPGATLAYQWFAGATPIAGATGATFTTTAAELGKPVQCRIIAINEEADENSGSKAGGLDFSNPAQVVAPAPETMPPIAPAFIAAPEASAPLSVGGPGGQTLTCDPREEEWRGLPEEFTYEWYRNGAAPISGTGATTKDSTTVTSATPAAGHAPFAVGQRISGVGIAEGTTITAIEGSTLTLSAAAKFTLAKATLSAVPTTPTYQVGAANLASAAAFQCVVVATNDGGPVRKASANLTTTGPPPDPSPPHPRAFVLDVYRVYAQSEGELALVSVLPSGEAVHTHATVGTRGFAEGGLDAAADGNATDSVIGAVSADGERIFFSATTKEPPRPIHQSQAMFVPRGPEGVSRLYLRLNPLAEQGGVEKVGEEFHCTEPEKACTVALSKGIARFEGADPEASKALYLEGEDLFEVDIGKAIAYQAEPETEIAGDVTGVLGASEDLSRVYLVSEALCSSEPNSEGEAAQAGEPNLYLYQAGQSCGAGELAFVGGLAEGDVKADEGISVIASQPFERRSRVSEDGLHAAFMSRARLTEYDNTDAAGGEPAAEVFLYDAAAEELRCASCNPSGARPQGVDLHTAQDPVWAAAQIPGWATQWHPASVLSEDGGRLFFESFEALVARDSNGKLDVYEWQEAESKEECEEAGAERYVSQSEGCLSLISAGTSPIDSQFIDASPSGSDVFFRTSSGLVGADYGLVDVYDARIEGGFPEEGEEEPECQGEACQSPPSPPPAQTPASSAFQGAGNLSEGAKPRRRCPKGKRRVTRAGKAKCVKRKARKGKSRRGARR